MTTTAPAQQEPIFKHRFDTTKAGDISHVVDSIGLMTDRAKSILHMLFGNFENENRLADNVMQAAIDAAIQEIEDIDGALRAYCEAADKSKGAA